MTFCALDPDLVETVNRVRKVNRLLRFRPDTEEVSCGIGETGMRCRKGRRIPPLCRIRIRHRTGVRTDVRRLRTTQHDCDGHEQPNHSDARVTDSWMRLHCSQKFRSVFDCLFRPFSFYVCVRRKGDRTLD